MKEFITDKHSYMVGLSLAAAVLTVAACPFNVHAETVKATADVSGRASVGPGAAVQTETAAAEDGSIYNISDNNLEWGEIDALIHSYNATVVRNRNEWASDSRKSKDAQELRDYLIDKADEYDGLYEQAQAVNAMTAANYKSSADSMRRQAESSVADTQTIELQYELIEKQTAETARKAFLEYYRSQYEQAYDSLNKEYLEKVYASTLNRQKLGMATELEALSAKENLDAAKAAILSAGSNTGSSRNTLLVMCGWKYDTVDAVIGALPEFDIASISSIDYEGDKAKAKAANLTLKMDEIKLDNAKKGSYTSLVVEQNQNQLDNDTQSFGINFKAAYDGLVNAATAYNNAVSDKSVAERNLKTAANQLSLGMISNIEYEGVKNKAAAAEYAGQAAYIALLQAKSSYDAALNGNL